MNILFIEDDMIEVWSFKEHFSKIESRAYHHRSAKQTGNKAIDAYKDSESLPDIIF